MSIITRWFGRFGNNIQQVSNALYYCRENRLNFSFLRHPIIKNFSLDYGRSSEFRSRFFFYDGPEKDFECDIIKLNQDRRNICLQHITKNLDIPKREVFDEETLVVHVRSGDIFSNSPANTYVPNPLSYYKKIIKDFQSVIVVAEDYNNPVVNILKNESKVKIQSSTLREDFSILMNCKNLASSGVGTFCLAAALCSTNIKNFYATDIFEYSHLNPSMLYNTDVNVEITKIDNYIKIGEWKNTEQQRKIMLQHNL